MLHHWIEGNCPGRYLEKEFREFVLFYLFEDVIDVKNQLKHIMVSLVFTVVGAK
jgi:hypothetical protein